MIPIRAIIIMTIIRIILIIIVVVVVVSVAWLQILEMVLVIMDMIKGAVSTKQMVSDISYSFSVQSGDGF